MNKQGKQYLITGLIMFLLVGVLTFYFVQAAEESNINKQLENSGIAGMEIINFEVDGVKITEKDLTIIIDSQTKHNLRNVFIEKRSGVIEQDIYLENKGNSDKSYQLVTHIEIDYDEIRWNGTRYKLNSTPLTLGSWSSNGKLIAPNIFMDDKYHKKINYRDLAQKGGYALAYEKDGKYYVDLRMDNVFVRTGETKYIDPVYINSTDGFSTIAAGADNPTGLTFNGSSLWLIDYTDSFVYEFSLDGTNLTGGFSVVETGQPQGITTNGTDFWAGERTGAIDHYIYPDYSNQIPGMAGAINLRGITNNGTFLFTVDDADALVYYQNFSGDEEGNFNLGAMGSNAPNDITYVDGSEFWVIDNVDNFMYHIIDEVNQTDGFSIAYAEATNPTALATDGTSFWVADATDGFIYKFIVNDTISPSVTINSPLNQTYYIITTNFSLTVTDDKTLDGCWFTINSGTTNYTMTNVTASIFNYTNYTMTSGSHTAEFYCNDSANNINNTESVMFAISPISLKVDLTNPPDGTILITLSQNFSANYTVTNTNLTNASYYLWYTNGSIFNQTNFTIIGLTNTTMLDITNLSLGNFKWNVYFCTETAATTLCDWEDNNSTFIVGASITDDLWNNYTFETASEDFQLNLSLFTGTSLVSANLTYNGTNYPVSDITIDKSDYVLRRTVDIPLTVDYFSDVLYEFNWSFIYVDSSDVQTHQTTTTREQNVTYIVINVCNDTYTSGNSSALNFTMYDEISGDQINATVNNTDFEVTFEYWLGSGSVVKNYSYQNLTNNETSSFAFCIHPWNETLQADMDLQYDSVGYSPRTYYLRNASLDNITNNIRLELLDDSEAVKFFVEVREGMIGFPGATVSISKYFTGEGGYRAIGIRETDVDGKFIEYFELDQTYQFSIVKDGVSYGTITKQSFCTEAPCEIILQIEEAETDMWQGYYDEFATNVAYTLNYNDTTKMVTYTFNDLTGLAQSFALDVIETEYNESGAIVFEPDGTYCNKTLAAVAGTLSCNLTNYTQGDFTAIGYISRSPPKIVDSIKFIISSIKDVLGVLGIFASFLIIVVIALVGVWNPAVGVILTAFAVLMMKLLGFVAFSYTTVILIIIMAVILAFKLKS